MKPPTAWKITLTFLALYSAFIWLAALNKFTRSDKARLIACNVGQGDALLIIDGKTQILIDGGPSGEVANCLSRHLPFWDRTIELVILTHPEADHFTGLIEVFRRYHVATYFSNDLENSTQSYQVLEDLIRAEGSQILFPENARSLRLGLIRLDILHPTKAFLAINPVSKNTNLNDFSIVISLERGDFQALFTGDILPETSSLIGGLTDVDLIKVPHHGSKNGLTQKLLTAASPEIAIISVGKNQWGHPHQEILDMLESASVKILRTDLVGDIVLDMN